MMIYNLNNIRLKGKAGNKNIGAKDKKLQTYIVSSADLLSGYVFRADVAYDYDVTLENIEKDTSEYHYDHSYPFLRKNDRLKYSYCPQPPTKLDNQTNEEYRNELSAFNTRKNFVEGCHVKPQYTATAHYFMINRDINANNWYFVSDDDAIIQSCIFKVFSEKFLDGNALYFTCRNNKNLTLEEAGKASYNSRNELLRWAKDNGIKFPSIYEKAQMKIERDLYYHKFHDTKPIDGVDCYVRGENPIRHPLPAKDEGVIKSILNYKEFSRSDCQIILSVDDCSNVMFWCKDSQ
jgi:hypothetical protein